MFLEKARSTSSSNTSNSRSNASPTVLLEAMSHGIHVQRRSEMKKHAWNPSLSQWISLAWQLLLLSILNGSFILFSWQKQGIEYNMLHRVTGSIKSFPVPSIPSARVYQLSDRVWRCVSWDCWWIWIGRDFFSPEFVSEWRQNSKVVPRLFQGEIFLLHESTRVLDVIDFSPELSWTFFS